MDHVELLRSLFLTHPAWLAAAEHLKDGCSSRIHFTHQPGDFHLLRKNGQNLLLVGVAKDPDLSFRFTPKSIERLAAVPGADVADFALELLACARSEDPTLHVRIRILSGFTKLLLRGYIGMLMHAGPRVLSQGGGGHSLSDARKLIASMRRHDDEDDA